MFDEVKFAVEMHTGHTIKRDVDDDGYEVYLLIDPSGEVDGDPFEDFIDLVDYVTQNDYVYEELCCTYR